MEKFLHDRFPYYTDDKKQNVCCFYFSNGTIIDFAGIQLISRGSRKSISSPTNFGDLMLDWWMESTAIILTSAQISTPESILTMKAESPGYTVPFLMWPARSILPTSLSIRRCVTWSLHRGKVLCVSSNYCRCSTAQRSTIISFRIRMLVNGKFSQSSLNWSITVASLELIINT